MQFFLVRYHSDVRQGRYIGYLVRDNWDDWGLFATLFHLIVFDENGEKHDLGGVKIGQKGLQGGGSGAAVEGKIRKPFLEYSFEELNEDYFSLGMGENYYEELMELDPNLRSEILYSLKDVIYDKEIFEKYKNEHVMAKSLLRYVNSLDIDNYRTILDGGCPQTEFEFRFKLSEHPENNLNSLLTFSVKPKSIPSMNFHVLIGRNGVGKTSSLKKISSLMQTYKNIEQEEPVFSKVLHVVFSIFDIDKSYCLDNKTIIIGLPKVHNPENQDTEAKISIKDKKSLSYEFSQCLEKCSTGLRKERLLKILKFFEYDTLFKEIDILDSINEYKHKNKNEIEEKFNKLSSGHAIILLTLFQLVEHVDNKTLILLDEPESHLHPPLLSAFIRAVSDLATMRNAVVICATHSPIVLQEVPRNCVWKLSRSGDTIKAERPNLETFGENVSTLTREVFGLDINETGYTTLLKEFVDQGYTKEDVMRILNNQLGCEGQFILSNLIALRETTCEN